MDLLPLLAFPLAYFVRQIMRHKKAWIKVVAAVVGLVLVFYSMGMTAKYSSPKRSSFHSSGMVTKCQLTLKVSGYHLLIDLAEWVLI